MYPTFIGAAAWDGEASAVGASEAGASVAGASLAGDGDAAGLLHAAATRMSVIRVAGVVSRDTGLLLQGVTD
jgi:hypothetical protein